MAKRRVHKSKQAVVRDAPRRKRRRAASSATASNQAHDREFSRMNERRTPEHVHAAARGDQPPYLGERARGLIRRVARLAMAPLSIARAVVDRLRDRD
jgi:hypothetical protein